MEIRKLGIELMNKHLLNVYSIPDSVLASRYKRRNRYRTNFVGNFSLLEEKDKYTDSYNVLW